MAALTQPVRLDLSGTDPKAARAAIRGALATEPTATRKVYAALAHKVWTLLIEARLDEEVRDWHGLIQRVRSHITGRDDAAAERMVALADLLRESISFAEASPARELIRRPHARRILETLRDAGASPVARQTLLKTLGLGSSHISNILTQLVALKLVERQGRGKEAEFRLTAFGRETLDSNSPTDRDRVVAPAVETAGFPEESIGADDNQHFPIPRAEFVEFESAYPFDTGAAGAMIKVSHVGSWPSGAAWSRWWTWPEGEVWPRHAAAPVHSIPVISVNDEEDVDGDDGGGLVFLDTRPRGLRFGGGF